MNAVIKEPNQNNENNQGNLKPVPSSPISVYYFNQNLMAYTNTCCLLKIRMIKSATLPNTESERKGIRGGISLALQP